MSFLQTINLKKITDWPFLIITYSFLFPFSLAIANIFLAVFILKWLTDIFLGNLIINKKIIISLIIYALFFITIGISVFYSLDKETGLKFVYRNLPLLIFPILFFTASIKNISQTIFKSVLIFTIAIFIIDTLSLVTAIFEWLESEERTEFLNSISLNNFSKAVISYDYLYLGLYTSFALIISVYILLSEKSKLWHKRFSCVSILLFFISLILLGGRNPLITSICIAIAMISYYSIKQKRIKFLIGSLILVFSAIYINIQYNDYFKERVGELVNYNNEYTLDKHWGGRGVRIKIWDCALEISSKRLLTGVGIGDTEFMLTHCYYEKNISALIHFNREYNVHNQYLQVLLEAGIFGLFSLFVFLFYPFLYALKNKNYLHILFLLIVASFIVTETIFHRNFGVIFFGFFHSLLYLKSIENEKK